MSFIWVFPLVILSIVGVFVSLWLWTQYLETGKPSQIRFLLQLGLGCIMLLQTYIWLFHAFYYDWVFLVLLMCDIFGMMDAILRYPMVHDLDSLFSLKQLLLLGIKTCIHAFGWRSVGKSATAFLAAMCLCCWAIPLGYLMALPIGDTRSQIGAQVSSVRDYDIFYKLYYVLGSYLITGRHGGITQSVLFRGSFLPCDIREGAAIREEFWETVLVNSAFVSQILSDNVPGMQGILVSAGAVDKRSTRRSNKEI